MNNDVVTRDTIIFGEYDEKEYYGGVRHFKGLPIDKLDKLLKLDFLEQYDYYPTSEDFVEFMRIYDGYTAHGYAVSINRDDYRVTIEGVKKHLAEQIDISEIIAFTNAFRDADEFYVDQLELYCWYD